MRILVAPQEYKGTLTAAQAAEAIAAGVRDVMPEAILDLLPMADGGPGTAAALLAALGGEWRSTPAHDPLMRPIPAAWALLAGGTAVVESAAASGLALLRADELDPRRASSFGTGELIAAALDGGCRSFIIGLGGSATNDGGAGMAAALGYRFLDGQGVPLPQGGAALARLASIDPSSAHPRLRESGFQTAVDVANPLCGPEGASAVFGPQKGADTGAVAELDAALARLAEVVARDLGVEVAGMPGAGAAGGLGAGCVAFLGARFRSGAALVGQAAGLEQRARAVEAVITGEGRLDGQTVFGKAPLHVASVARATGKRVVCLAGSLGPGHEDAARFFDDVEVAGSGDGPAAALRTAARVLSSRLVRGDL